MLMKKNKLKYSIKDLDKTEYRDIKPDYLKIKICVIDDEDFATGTLNSEGFHNINVRKEFGGVEDYKQYDIILVDVTDVGTRYYDNEGVGVAEAIQDKYPEKIVAIYTARDLDTIRKKFKKYDDIDIIPKENVDELKKKIKEYTRELLVPYYSCKRFEKILNRNKEMTYLEKATAEHGFVASIIEGDKEYINGNAFKYLSEGLSIINSVLGIITSLVALCG